MSEKPELTCPFSGCHGKVPDGTDYCTGCGRPRTSVAEELRALGRDADRRMLPNLPDHLADEPWGHR